MSLTRERPGLLSFLLLRSLSTLPLRCIFFAVIMSECFSYGRLNVQQQKPYCWGLPKTDLFYTFNMKACPQLSKFYKVDKSTLLESV